jgi:putative flippase GtrA
MNQKLLKEVWMFVRFFALGLATYVLASLQMTVYLKLLHLSPALGYSLTQILLVVVNFTVARVWIFKSKSTQVANEAMLFLATCIFFRFCDWCLFMVLYQSLRFPYLLAIFASLTALYPIKYLTYKLGVFNERRGERPTTV